MRYWAEEGEGTGGGAVSADIQISAPADAKPEPAPAEPVAPAPEPAAPSETPAPEGAPGEEATPKSPGNARLQKRFSELTRTIYQERQRAEAAEQRARELEQGRSQQAQPPRGPAEAPKLENFKDYEEYAEAKGRFIARQELARAVQHQSAQQQREQALTMASEIRAKWETSEAEFKGKVEDYDDVMADGSVRFSDGVNVSLLDSDMGPALAYYLKKNPVEAQALSQLSPVAAARAIGKLEVKLSSAPPAQAQPTRVPPPPTPVKAAAPADDLSQVPISEYIRRRNKQELDRKRNG